VLCTTGDANSFETNFVDLKVRINDVSDEIAKMKQRLRTMWFLMLPETLGKRMKVADRNRFEKSLTLLYFKTPRWNEILGKMILDGEQKDFPKSLCLECLKQFTKRVSFIEKVINRWLLNKFYYSLGIKSTIYL
jgi:chorismate mutase